MTGQAEISSACAEPKESGALARAEANWLANLAAFETTQTRLASCLRDSKPPCFEWLFARDGALTAMLPGPRWWGACSVPLAAARFMLRSMQIHGNVACFLSPQHAAQLSFALQSMEARQAIIALVPDPSTLAVILSCGDFSTEIGAHRLWFACGEHWDQELRRLLIERPGLPTPQQFIRPVLADSSAVDALIGPAQNVFAEQNARRADLVRSHVNTWKPRRSSQIRVCVLTRSLFRLWDDAPQVMADVIQQHLPPPSPGLPGEGTRDHDSMSIVIDCDDPASASTLAIAATACNDAILAADLSRADMPDVAHRQVTWITWITKPKIPPAVSAGPNDALLVADAQWVMNARSAGWPSGRVAIAGWPPQRSLPSEIPVEPVLALIADTRTLEPPASVCDYSSHRLLWERIAEELTRNPQLIGENSEQYLSRLMSEHRISPEGFDRRTFLESLIVPAYQQGLARMFREAGLPIRLYGNGWDRYENLAADSRGPVTSRDQLHGIAAASAGLIHAWPWSHAHPIETLGRPVLRSLGRPRETVLRDAQRIFDAASSITAARSLIERSNTPAISRELIANMVFPSGKTALARP